MADDPYGRMSNMDALAAEMVKMLQLKNEQASQRQPVNPNSTSVGGNQVNPNLDAILGQTGRGIRRRLDTRGRPIDPNAPTGLDWLRSPEEVAARNQRHYELFNQGIKDRTNARIQHQNTVGRLHEMGKQSVEQRKRQLGLLPPEQPPAPVLQPGQASQPSRQTIFNQQSPQQPSPNFSRVPQGSSEPQAPKESQQPSIQNSLSQKVLGKFYEPLSDMGNMYIKEPFDQAGSTLREGLSDTLMSLLNLLRGDFEGFVENDMASHQLMQLLEGLRRDRPAPAVPTSRPMTPLTNPPSDDNADIINELNRQLLNY